MDVTAFTSRLSKCRKIGPDRWSACCPAHQDKTPSLLVSERKDGSIGIHCFSGCSTQSIVESIGLTLVDLFPDSPHEPGYKPPRREQLTHADALRGLAKECGIIAVLASDIADKKRITPRDADRGFQAMGRILTALEFVEHGQ